MVLFWRMMTSSMTSWLQFVYKRSHMSLVHLHIKFNDHISNRFSVIVENVTILFKHDYRRQLCRHTVTSSGTSSIWNCFYLDNLHMVFPYLMSIWVYNENCEILKFENFHEKYRSQQTFSWKVAPTFWHCMSIAMSISYFLSFYTML